MSDAPVDPREPILDTQIVAPAVLASAGPRFTVGGVLSRTLRVWWAHVWAFSAMSVVVFAPMLVGFPLVAWSTFQRGQAGGAPQPAELARYLVEKGSIAVDGISLTVAGVDDKRRECCAGERVGATGHAGLLAQADAVGVGEGVRHMPRDECVLRGLGNAAPGRRATLRRGGLKAGIDRREPHVVLQRRISRQLVR